MTMFSYKQSTLLRSRAGSGTNPHHQLCTRDAHSRKKLNTTFNIRGSSQSQLLTVGSSATGSLRLKFAYISLFNVFLRDSALQKCQRYLQVSLREVWFSLGFGGIAGSRHTSTDENHTNDKPLITLSESTGWRWRDGQNGHFLPFAFESGGNSEVCECAT